MWEWLIYALALYGAVSLWIQLLSRWSWLGEKRRQDFHFVILLYNSQQKLEWVYRSLMYLSRISGSSVSITFIDYGSQDDTLKILQRLTWGKNDHRIIFLGQEYPRFPEMPPHAIRIDLRERSVQNLRETE